MTNPSPVSRPIRLADYRPFAWQVERLELVFDLGAETTDVAARLHLRPDPAQPGEPLQLDGEALQLISIAVDGEALPEDRYVLDGSGLRIDGLTGPCVLETRARIHPAGNTRLEGLYASGGMLLTQCEAQGFRRITWFPDRPDVLTRYEVELRADRSRYPILLGNGDCVAQGDLDDGRHFARWNDPHPKPSYLFALVAGDIDCLEAPYTTSEGRDIIVRVWTAPHDVQRCRHALESTLRALRWDEQRFGRAYDLGEFNIVAVHDFTMGAMENKGLNIFNARYVLADPDSATDADFEAIESVIGHEHFHNWSGNRVTLRDWFQLSLKEGFTVFRDQEFTADLHSRAMKRIDDVRLLKSRQFVEDSGPLAHPVRLSEYTEINNFYTVTVYEKGAEIVRMLHTLLGEAAFRRGSDLYFARHDGQAVTIEDFLAAMSEAGGRDLTQFARWYAQAGTPVVRVTEHWDATCGDYALDIEQSTPPTPGQTDKQPLHIPLAYALYAADGATIAALPDADAVVQSSLIELVAHRHTLRWHGLLEKPLPVFLQALSAPVRLEIDYDAIALARIANVEPDALTRWEAIQRLAADALLNRGQAPAAARAALISTLGALLDDATQDPAFVAECQRLPDVWTLADQCAEIDLDAIAAAREALLDELAAHHAERYARVYARLRAAHPGDRFDAAAIAARRLTAICLVYLTRRDSAERAQSQFDEALCMSDRLAALNTLVHADAPGARSSLARFRSRAEGDLLVTDKWLGILVTRPHPDAVETVRALLNDPTIWHPTNPNRVRAILGNFARGNPIACHRPDGAGYALLFDGIAQLDVINPQVAARLIGTLEPWKRLDATRRGHIEAGLKRLLNGAPSTDSRDMLERLLA